MSDVKKIAEFRFWCQKVLPTVYDDSLSYYELLCKVVNALKVEAEEVLNLGEIVDNCDESVKEYIKTVNEYKAEVEQFAGVVENASAVLDGVVLNEWVEVPKTGVGYKFAVPRTGVFYMMLAEKVSGTAGGFRNEVLIPCNFNVGSGAFFYDGNYYRISFNYDGISIIQKSSTGLESSFGQQINTLPQTLWLLK